MTNPFDELRNSSKTPADQLDHGVVRQNIDERISGVAPGSAFNRRRATIVGGTFSGLIVAGVATALVLGPGFTGTGVDVPEVARPATSPSASATFEPVAFLTESTNAIEGDWILETEDVLHLVEGKSMYSTTFTTPDGLWQRTVFGKDVPDSDNISFVGDEDVSTPNDDGTVNRYQVSPANGVYATYPHDPAAVEAEMVENMKAECAADPERSEADCDIQLARYDETTKEMNEWTPRTAIKNLQAPYEEATKGESSDKAKLNESIRPDTINGVEVMCFTSVTTAEEAQALMPNDTSIFRLGSQSVTCFDAETKLPASSKQSIFREDGTIEEFSATTFVWHPRNAETQHLLEPSITGLKEVDIQTLLDAQSGYKKP